MKLLLLTLSFLSILSFATAGISVFQGIVNATGYERRAKDRVLRGEGGQATDDVLYAPDERELKSLNQLTMDWYRWFLCNGDGPGGSTDLFALFTEDICPEQVDVPGGWTFQAGIGAFQGALSCPVSAGKSILIPITNGAFSSDPDLNETLGYAKNITKVFTDLRAVTKSTLDGVTIKAKRLRAAENNFVFNCAEDVEPQFEVNVLGWPTAVDGYYVVIPPQPAGKTIVVELASSVSGDPELDFKYTLTVV